MFTQFAGLVVGQIPAAHQTGNEERPVECVISGIEVYRLFHRAYVELCKSAEQTRKGTVALGVVHGPCSAATAPIAGTAAKGSTGILGKHQTTHHELAGLVVIGRQLRS